MAYTWGLGLGLAVFGSLLQCGTSGPCARGLLRLLRKYVWPSPYAQVMPSDQDEHFRLARESCEAVRRQWRGGHAVHPPGAD
eukprot:12797762-Alexandrium_andersonii.AAC.1